MDLQTRLNEELDNACECGEYKDVFRLLENGADPTHDEYRPLKIAINRGLYQIIHLLLINRGDKSLQKHLVTCHKIVIEKGQSLQPNVFQDIISLLKSHYKWWFDADVEADVA